MRTISENVSYVWCELQTELFVSRSIIKAQEEALTQNSGDFTSLFVYPILIGSLLFNLAIGGKLLKKIRKEKEGIFGKKKHYVRRKHLTQMRDK